MAVSKLKIFLKLMLLLLCFTQLGLLLLFYPNSFLQQNEAKGHNSREQIASSYKDNVLQELRQRSKDVLSKCIRNPDSQTVSASLRGSNKLFQNIKLLKSSSQIMVIPEDKLAWCIVPKAASSSIAVAIVEAKNLTSMLDDEGQFQVFLRKFYKRNQLASGGKEKCHFASFYVTRHPFSRIVSAFKDKLEKADGHDGTYFYRMYGKKIVKNFRRIKDFSEKRANKEPTFKEFVLYLINTAIQNYDLHWQPIAILCDVCNYNYNFTIKFENFGSEFQALLNFLKEGKFIPPDFEIKWKNKGSNAGKEDKITRAYMKQIPRSYVRKLYEIYKADFVYFNYDVTGYM